MEALRRQPGKGKRGEGRSVQVAGVLDIIYLVVSAKSGESSRGALIR